MKHEEVKTSNGALAHSSTSAKIEWEPEQNGKAFC